MPIEVVAYDPRWPSRFASARDAIAAALRDVPYVGIEHVGSTSVPGLAANPVIDVDVIVHRANLGMAIDALERIGYQDRGDLGIPDRHALAAPDDGTRRNVYVVVAGSLAVRNHLAIRDALRSNRLRRDGYADLKRRLASETDDIDTYITGKTRFLLDLLGDAGFTDGELAAIGEANRPPPR